MKHFTPKFISHVQKLLDSDVLTAFGLLVLKSNKGLSTFNKVYTVNPQTTLGA